MGMRRGCKGSKWSRPDKLVAAGPVFGKLCNSLLGGLLDLVGVVHFLALVSERVICKLGEGWEDERVEQHGHGKRKRE